MKKNQLTLVIMFVLFFTMNVQAGWFDEDEELVAVCKTKALRVKSMITEACKVEGEEEACDVLDAMKQKDYDEHNCKLIMKYHKRFSR